MNSNAPSNDRGVAPHLALIAVQVLFGTWPIVGKIIVRNIVRNNVSLIPGDLTMEQAAAMPSDALTALRGLEDVLRLKPDESVMIFGASGGIGHLAVQLAKRLGVRVFAVA
jgi:NADPH:quinone reductase-like Zn-dependent oxidoreductase